MKLTCSAPSPCLSPPAENDMPKWSLFHEQQPVPPRVPTVIDKIMGNRFYNPVCKNVLQ